MATLIKDNKIEEISSEKVSETIISLLAKGERFEIINN